MIKKSLTIISIVFIAQIIVSCGFECQAPSTYEIQYNKVSITPYNTAGFNSAPVVDTVYKNAFGLGVNVEFEMTQIAFANPLRLNGLNKSFALSCTDDTYNYIDPIKNIELYVTDTQTGIKTAATRYFGVNGFDNELISLEEFFKTREDWYDGFLFELANFDSIPNSAVFTAEAYLASGTVFVKETETIYFYDSYK